MAPVMGMIKPTLAKGAASMGFGGMAGSLDPGTYGAMGANPHGIASPFQALARVGKAGLGSLAGRNEPQGQGQIYGPLSGMTSQFPEPDEGIGQRVEKKVRSQVYGAL